MAQAVAHEAHDRPRRLPVGVVDERRVPVEAFRELWAETSGYFRAQPGFISLRLHRAVSPNASHRFVNVARWESAEQFEAAHQGDEFRHLVSRPSWREFPSSPSLYEVVAEHQA